MSFLAPLFLWGAVAVALPVLFHLMRRSPRVQRVFSSLMFLNASAPRLTRRSRWEHILLLLLRCAVICLLALAFARPFLKQPPPPPVANATTGKSILLLDVSASMQRDGLWPAARDRVEAWITQASSADQLAVFTFDQQLIPLVSFEEWNSTAASDRAGLVRSRLADTKPGWGSTALDAALLQTAEWLADDGDDGAAVKREILVVTDLQEGSQTSDLPTYPWPDGVTVRTERLTPDRPGNASLQWLADDGRDGDLSVRLRVHNASDSRQEQFRVGWARESGEGFSGEPLEVYVPAGQSRLVSLPVTSTPGADPSIRLTGDEQPFDNRLFILPPEKARLQVLYLGEDVDKNGAGPLYFLKRAFPNTPRQEIQVVPVKSGEALPTGMAREAALIVVAGTPRESSIRALRESVEQGGTLLFAAGDAASAPVLAQLMGLDSFPLQEVVPVDYAMLGEIDFRHPLFAPFADERFSDFTGIHFWKYRRMDASGIPHARMLARFDNGDPALLEVPLGQGRLVLLASSWVPADSQLALSSKFVPLLFSLLELGGRWRPPPTQRLVGDPLPLTAADPGDVSVTGPGGAVLLPDPVEGSVRRVWLPGLYTIHSSPASRQFAVNLDPLESRTAPLPADELERLGVPVPTVNPDPVRLAQRQVLLHNAELEARQKYWSWVILATLLLLVVETWLAGWTARRAPLAEGTNA